MATATSEITDVDSTGRRPDDLFRVSLRDVLEAWSSRGLFEDGDKVELLDGLLVKKDDQGERGISA